MKFLRSIYKQLIQVIVLALVPGFIVLASPPTSPYTPGETTDPSCSQGDSNCSVSINVSNLSDTTISSVASGHVLIYDGSDSYDNKAISGDATLASTGALSIAADAVALGTDTTGDFVGTITGGSGVASTGATTGEDVDHTLSLSDLTSDWSQGGAFDIILDNIDSQLQILDSDGSHYGIFDVTDLASDRTYTFPDATGTIALLSNIISDGTSVNNTLRWDGSDWVEESSFQLTATAVRLRPAIDEVATIPIEFFELSSNGSDKLTFQAPESLGASYSFTWPEDDGGIDQFLKTDGSGVLSWATPSGGSGGEWTDTGTVVHPNESTTDNVVIGGTTQAGADIVLNVDGSAVFNEQGAAVDFRVEGDTATSLFLVDASADGIGIGSPSATNKLTVRDSVGGDTAIAAFAATAADPDKDGISISLHDTSDLDSTSQFLRFLKTNSTEIGSVAGDGAGGVVFNTSSDGRLKENIVDTKYGLEDLLNIHARDFNFIGSPVTTTGFIAQELLEIYPTVVSEAEDQNKRKGLRPGDEGFQYMQVAYGKLTPLLVQSIQDLYHIVILMKDDFSKKVQTEELCLEDTCITKQELQELLELKELLLDSQ